MKKINGQQMLSTKEAAEYCGIKEGTLRAWRHEGVGPKSFRVGRKLVYYALDDLDGWLREQYEGSVTS